MVLFLSHSAIFAATDSFLVLGPPSLSSNQVQLALTGEASVSYVIETSTDTQNWSPVATNSSPDITREVVFEVDTNGAAFYRAWRNPLPMFPGALVARSNVTLNGNSIQIDSYDSGDTNYSTPGGLYDPTKQKAGGDVFCGEGFINVSNANIRGKLLTGSINAGQVSIGPDGIVGDLSWTGPGVQPGWYNNNFRYALPDIAPPYTTGLPPTSDGTNLWYLATANYMYAGNFSASTSHTIYVAGDATVYVTGSFDFRGRIIIGPGASLELYVGGSNTRLNELFTDGHPTSFRYFGLPTNLAIALLGAVECAAIVYAPQARLKLGAAGSDPYDFSGACVVESIIINGHFSFHYDENLKVIGPKR